ncbi:MAG: hypothetical protein HWQ44_10000 [Nostoc sp. JL34]|uniref:hypothetical protein n=2 Tax=Nostoc TaxID=1177 RepID=UPI001D8E0288|nr:hypothetical protein [Nostoc sp. JL34]
MPHIIRQMNIYLFSYHVPDRIMIQDLGAPITTQFKGEISDIYSKGNLIFFIETLFMGGQKIKANHTIPTESIVIVEAPPILQGDWLAAGASTVLVPQMKPETTAWGAVVLNYCRLIQIHQIEVITSPWSSNTDTEAFNGKILPKPGMRTKQNSSLSLASKSV